MYLFKYILTSSSNLITVHLSFLKGSLSATAMAEPAETDESPEPYLPEGREFSPNLCIYISKKHIYI